VNINFRHEARCCLDRARSLLAHADESSIRYVCLELRFAIEYLVYQNLQAYLEEVDNAALQKWTPKQVINEMLEIDPLADKSAGIACGIEEVYGMGSKDMRFIGEDRRFSVKWANSNHNALGNFLHAPTLFQINSGNVPTLEKMTVKIQEIVGVIEKILSSPVFNVNFGQFYSFKCDCGRNIKRRIGSFKLEDGIKCPSCGAVWDIVSEDETVDHVKFLERRIIYRCFACGLENTIGVNKIREGERLICQCGAESIVVLALQSIENAKNIIQCNK